MEKILISWSKYYSVGIDLFDEQHKELVNVLRFNVIEKSISLHPLFQEEICNLPKIMKTANTSF